MEFRVELGGRGKESSEKVLALPLCVRIQCEGNSQRSAYNLLSMWFGTVSQPLRLEEQSFQQHQVNTWCAFAGEACSCSSAKSP